MVIFAGLSVKRSPNSQMLKVMLASGLVMTRSGWDTLSGPTCRADCSSSVPATAAAASAYTGQRVSIPPMPDVASVWVAVFRNVAIRAHASAAAIAKTAARRAGEPRIPAAASTAIAPPDANTADSHCAVSGAGVPARRLGHRQEHRQCRADGQYGGPRGAGHVLADPHPAQHQDEDQLSDEDGLDHRQLAVVQGEGLEGERTRRSDPAGQPQRLPEQVADQAPAPLPLRRAGARRVLRHQVDRVGESGGQGEYHGEGHAPAPVPSAMPASAQVLPGVPRQELGPSLGEPSHELCRERWPGPGKQHDTDQRDAEPDGRRLLHPRTRCR